MSTANGDTAAAAAGRRNRRRVALTGAAGSLATDIIPALLEAGYELACVDRIKPAQDFGQDWFVCSINDRTALAAALAGCEAVIHLAGIPLEDDWDRILGANIDGTQAVLETARAAGISKAVLASSIHAAGYVPVPAQGGMVPDDIGVQPNTFYGVSKAALEALGSYYHHRYGMDVTCLRIASRFDRPHNVRMLSTWLSPADAGRLFLAALGSGASGFRTVWGVSANSRSYLSPAGGAAIGYVPQDNAEEFAPAVEGSPDETARETEWDRKYIGGVFSGPHPPLQPQPAPTTSQTNDNTSRTR